MLSGSARDPAEARGDGPIEHGLRAQSKNDAAFKSYQAGFAIRQKLAATDPTNAAWQMDLVRSLWEIGTLDTAANPDAEKVKFLTKALALVQKLRDSGHLGPTQESWFARLNKELDKYKAK